MVLGDVVCFSSPILTLNGLTGKWSADSKLFQIDAESGVGVSTGVGSADILYTISEKQTTSTEVTTSSITFLQFEETTEKLVTDSRRTGQFFPLSFRQKKIGSLVGDNCSTEAVNRFMRGRASPLTCTLSFTSDGEVNIDDVLRTNAEFDAKTGFYQCAIKSVGNPTAASSVLDTDVILKARYLDLASAQLKLPFQPAVFLQSAEIHVSDLQPATHIVITGKPNLLKVI